LTTARAEHGLQFQASLQLEEGLPPIRASRVHVRKVLLNLLHNGIEAMQEAGVPQAAITITVRTMTDKNVAQVTIRDNGPGFTDTDIQRLFEPFFTTKAKGIGMGLTISRSLIEANGGQLWVDPQESPGATFHLTLPFAE
jgi:signal transduction histidine kinase